MPGPRRAASAAAALLLAAPLTALGTAAAPGTALADTGYTWRNAQIQGGGFVPGIVFNETEPDLIYARTDIGGAYRWNPDTERWIPLLDWVGWEDWGWTGVAGLATDPVDPDRVYAAVGGYTNSWDPDNGAVLRSTDRGETWEVTELPFKLGGNMPGRGVERLSVDPNDNRVLYLGAPGGNGLWRSTDHGATWSKVASFPNPGDYVANPGDGSGYSSDNQGVGWIAFDRSSGSPGSPTPDVYVGVMDKENTVYRSGDAGRTWERVPGQPEGHLAIEGVVDHENGRLYISTSDTGGPYDGGSGDVWRFDFATEEWTNISPVPSDSPDNHFGYGGLTIDRQNPGTLMVSTQISWWPDVQIYRTTDGGGTWTQAWRYGSYPERINRYDLDVSAAPWLTFGENPQPPVTSPKLGWMTQAMEIDPHDSDRMMYGTGATLYGTDDLTAWDAGRRFTIEVKAAGIEETAVNDLAAPPGGVPLVSALGDIGGFRHDDLTQVPDMMHTRPFHGSVTSLDFAERAPHTFVRVGSSDNAATSRIALSTDGGANWWAGRQPAGVTGPGTVAMAADGSAVVWSTEGAGVQVSTNYAGSWRASSGVPAGARVEADRVDPDRFYAFADGGFYVSTDGGETFRSSAAGGLPQGGGSVRFAAVPGRAGEVWLAGGTSGGAYGMWRSTDSGATFTPVAGVDEADTVGFGKAAPGADHPAVYTSARIGGVRGIFRSDDAGATWQRINDDEHRWAWTGAAITGDPDVYGRVYVSTNGRGIVYGDPAGGG
ncbi:xyloglucanase [Streptomonospora nanhaiensis]|uniref:xyloglucanase n=1 Tax=Streptomonospora nanhaiensis TaxID=1323731 RepID=UPI003557CBC7